MTPRDPASAAARVRYGHSPSAGGARLVVPQRRFPLAAPLVARPCLAAQCALALTAVRARGATRAARHRRLRRHDRRRARRRAHRLAESHHHRAALRHRRGRPRSSAARRTTCIPAEVRARPRPRTGPAPERRGGARARPDLVHPLRQPDNRDAARRLRAGGVSHRRLPRGPHRRLRARHRRPRSLTGDTAGGARAPWTRVTRHARRACARATASLPHPTRLLAPLGDPLLAVGGGSFLNELLEIAGGANMYDDLPAALAGGELRGTAAARSRRDPRRRHDARKRDARRSALAARCARCVTAAYSSFDTTIVNGPSARASAPARQALARAAASRRDAADVRALALARCSCSRSRSRSSPA